MSEVTSTTSFSAVMDSIDLGVSGDNIQLQFAKLQLALSEMSKNSAMEEMKAIEDSQAEQEQVAGLLQQARQLQANAKAGKGDCDGDTKASNMPVEMETYMKENKLAYDTKGDDLRMNEEEWDVAIASLQAKQESLGVDTQQKMVLIQDFMGQYNSYLTGANSSIKTSNDTTAAIARG